VNRNKNKSRRKRLVPPCLRLFCAVISPKEPNSKTSSYYDRRLPVKPWRRVIASYRPKRFGDLISPNPASYALAMRILITGDRNWECRPLARQIIGRLTRRYGSKIVIVHGDGNGVDQAFAIECREGNTAKWELGKRAGPLRNAEMIATKPVFVIAIHRDLARSKGTKDCVKQALEAGIPVYLFDNEHGEPRRVKADDRRLAWKA
jgi:hypothetical protein